MGVIAVHLGMAEEAQKLFVSSKRYDLLVALQQVSLCSSFAQESLDSPPAGRLCLGTSPCRSQGHGC